MLQSLLAVRKNVLRLFSPGGLLKTSLYLCPPQRTTKQNRDRKSRIVFPFPSFVRTRVEVFKILSKRRALYPCFHVIVCFSTYLFWGVPGSELCDGDDGPG